MAGLCCGIIGLPNVGKSTLFNALTRGSARTENYPFCTIEPNVGVVQVPEPRLEKLNAVEQRGKVVHPTLTVVDIAGLVEGASKGEGRGNAFLEHVHQADLLIHVVRAFEDANVSHVRSALDPVADIETVNLELALADLQHAERAVERYERRARGQDREARHALDVLQRILAHLDSGGPLRTLALREEDWAALPDCRFLTRKPVLYLANTGEDDGAVDHALVQRIRAQAQAEGNVAMAASARLEAELAELATDEALEFRRDAGLPEDALSRLIAACYRHLRLITFLTVGDVEVHGWTIRQGMTAPEAGGVIHSDFRDHFIRVEVISFADFARLGSRHAAKEHGLQRLEGKGYVVEDGDILFFRIGH